MRRRAWVELSDRRVTVTVENVRPVEDLMEVEFMPCPTCTEVTVVEVPPCTDEHGFDCPDRACTMCGTALTVAGVAMVGDIMAARARGRIPGAAPGRPRARSVA